MHDFWYCRMRTKNQRPGMLQKRVAQQTEKESAKTTEKEESIEKMVWKLGDTQAEDHPEVVSFGQFGEKLEHLTNGQIQVEIYPNSALGNHREMLGKCSDGEFGNYKMYVYGLIVLCRRVSNIWTTLHFYQPGTHGCLP